MHTSFPDGLHFESLLLLHGWHCDRWNRLVRPRPIPSQALHSGTVPRWLLVTFLVQQSLAALARTFGPRSRSQLRVLARGAQLPPTVIRSANDAIEVLSQPARNLGRQDGRHCLAVGGAEGGTHDVDHALQVAPGPRKERVRSIEFLKELSPSTHPMSAKDSGVSCER